MPSRGVSRRRGAGRGVRVAVLAVVPLALLLAGCGDDAPDKPEPVEGPEALWNPCDAIDAALVEDAFGTVATEQDGTAKEPECRFAPEESSGQPAIEANYLLFPAGLDEAWKTMGQPEDAAVEEPTIEHADAARVVVDVEKGQLYVSGFVQNGDLIQSVNVVAPKPYDEARVVAGVQTVLTAFSAHAEESGVTASASPSASAPADH